MKKLIAVALFAFSFTAVAHAYEGVMISNQYGEVEMKALTQVCADNQAEVSAVCKPAAKVCPKGYHKTAKYCWGGWKKGIYKCGYACRDINPDCQRGYNHEDCRN